MIVFKRASALLSAGLTLTLILASCDSADSNRDLAIPVGPTAEANARACEVRNNDTVDKLTECVTLDGVRAHQAALQAIADANGGTRADATPGYTASVDYVAQTLEAAGWDVERVPFTYDLNEAILEQFTPSDVDHPNAVITGTGYGDVTGAVIPVDLSLADPAATTSGCEASDFAGLDFSGSADIALIQRGPLDGVACFFSTKAALAEAAGAEAVVIFNQGIDGREGLFVGNAANFPDGSPSNLTIPVVSTTFAAGVSLSQTGSTARVAVELITVESENVIAEKAGDPGTSVIMVGAHLDSVPEGPGINDNGSGIAAILETAVRLEKLRPVNTLRLAFWGAEEAGLIGSSFYVDNLSSAERDAIALYLNFDMIGSPNFVRFVYDGDGSAFGFPGAPGSDVAEAFFEGFYSERGLEFEPVLLTSSDNLPFIEAGIPYGGIFTGAAGVKSLSEAAVYGGTAGDQYDPCYHLACDTFDNVSIEVLDLNADAVAAATLTFAMGELTMPSAPRLPAGRETVVAPKAGQLASLKE